MCLVISLTEFSWTCSQLSFAYDGICSKKYIIPALVCKPAAIPCFERGGGGGDDLVICSLVNWTVVNETAIVPKLS